MDARKKEVYSQKFEWTDDGPLPLDEGRVLSPQSLLESLDAEVALVGDGVQLYRQLIDGFAGVKVRLPTASAHQPRASQAAWLAFRAYLNRQTVSSAELLPTYIRPSDAELGKTKSK